MGKPLLDRLFTLAMWASVLLVMGLFCWILWDLLRQGLGHLSWSFLFSEPKDAGRAGGIAPILVSTLLILLMALCVSVPLGLATAAWLAEYAQSEGPFASGIRIGLDVLAGVPSIVFGLFGNAFFCVFLGLGFSILSGGLTLACMILPLLIRTIEAGLSAVPSDWRRGAAALGMSRASALWHVLLPAAAPSVLAGLLLSIGRASAETAALLFTSGYSDRMPESLSDSGRALSVHIYDLTMNVTGGDAAAYASALVLIALLLLVNASAFGLSERWLTKTLQKG